MKKIIFMMLLTIVSGITISSCTEENVQPTSDYPCSPNCSNNGGGASDPPGK
jgi:hypothetical protein